MSLLFINMNVKKYNSRVEVMSELRYSNNEIQLKMLSL